MIHYFFGFFSLIILIVTFYFCTCSGRKIGIAHIENKTHPKLEDVGVAESAVFGLLALLIAFTFSGAYERYENRKMQLVEEANIFDKAFNYIDIMPKEFQPTLRQDMRDYFDSYLQAFNDVRNTSKVNEDLANADKLEDKIWNATVKAGNSLDNKSYAQIYMPAFNDMFEMAHTGYYLTRIHPPIVIFVLLVALAALGAFLVGYNSADNKQKRPLHSICYILLTAFIVYVIINLEYPRIGFINLGIFDEILLNVREHMVDPAY